ncbi:MAG: heavy-metal-associated domain-containing protein [Anaerolineae bacterium]
MPVEKVIFDVPKMYADHHVEAVRKALLELPGIEQITASSALKRVVVRYDTERLNPSVIEQTLRAAGYAPGEEWELPKLPEGKEDHSPWFQVIPRVTTTDRRDLEMSGDFRKY